MNFKKIGLIKKNNNSDNLFIFISSSHNYETIQRISNFYVSLNNKYENVEFKIIKKETNNILIKIIDMISISDEKNIDVFIKDIDLPKLPNGEFYNDDLLGCEVIDEKGDKFGSIKRVLNSSNGVLLEIYFNQKTFIVPFIESFIIEVRLSKKIIIIKNLKEISELWKLILYQFFQKL